MATRACVRELDGSREAQDEVHGVHPTINRDEAGRGGMPAVLIRVVQRGLTAAPLAKPVGGHTPDNPPPTLPVCFTGTEPRGFF